MPDLKIHQCECALCKSGEAHSDQVVHHQINVFMSRLDEQQRRWYAALEALRMGHGGAVKMSQITGLSEKAFVEPNVNLSKTSKVVLKIGCAYQGPVVTGLKKI